MVRMFCLTSINHLPPEENVIIVNPYKDGAVELLSTGFFERQTPFLIDESTHLEYYKLTEISFGYMLIEPKYPTDVNAFTFEQMKDILMNNENKKAYVMSIYRKNLGLICIRMVRGAVKLIKVSKDVHELIVTTSKLFPNHLVYDLQIRIHCIKNTKVKGNISREEEGLYEDFAEQIENYCNNNNALRENAFNILTFKLPNQTMPNVLRQKLSDINRLINLLCDPQSGCYKNVPLDERYNQKIKCLLKERNKWKATKPRSLHEQSKNYRDVRHLEWFDTDIKKLKINDIDSSIIESILFVNVNIFKSKLQLHPNFLNICFTNLKTLTLRSCNIKELPQNFFDILPETVLHLILSLNDIRYISEKISKFINLQTLDLAGNCMLADDGIPWKHLSSSIKKLDFHGTCISKFPSTINKFKDLRYFRAGGKCLKQIPWNLISHTVHTIDVDGALEINRIDLECKINLTDLTLCNLGMKEFNCDNISLKIEAIILDNNSLISFNLRSHFTYLTWLSLSENGLDSINWKHLPASLTHIYLHNNKLKFIGNISHLIKLEILCVSYNELEYICPGMENLSNLQHVDLCKNNFTYSLDNNLEESLWKRLPPNCPNLEISKNTLIKLPCMIKNFTTQDLHVDSCELKHICPYLYTKFQSSKTFRVFDIANNPKIKNLMFIPQIIYQPPSSKEKSEDRIDSDKFRIRIDDSNYIVSSKFPKALLKPVYKFNVYKGHEASICCKCCANCGQQTDEEMIEQLMVMDCILQLKKIKSKNEDENETENLSDDVELVDTVAIYKYLLPGKWKTNIITNLCGDCLKVIKMKTDYAFEEYNKNIGKESTVLKKKKFETPDDTSVNQSCITQRKEVIPSPLTPVESLYPPQNQFSTVIPLLPNADGSYAIPCSSQHFMQPNIAHPYILTIKLPPINQIMISHRNKIEHLPTNNESLIYQQPQQYIQQGQINPDQPLFLSDQAQSLLIQSTINSQNLAQNNYKISSNYVQETGQSHSNDNNPQTFYQISQQLEYIDYGEKTLNLENDDNAPQQNYEPTNNVMQNVDNNEYWDNRL